MLVISQPDLGSGLVYMAIAVAVLFVGGTKWTHFAVLGVLAVRLGQLRAGGAPAVGVQVLKPYQVDRLTAFLNPTNDPRKQGYQLKQSIAGIGAGQKTGRGPAGATQTKLDFIPEHHTDFIFAVVGEEFGFAGCAIVLSLYALLLWRALRVLTMAKNVFGALVAGGIAAMLAFQIFVNVGHDDRDHADHRRAVTADELRRVLGDRHVHGDRPAAVDPRAGQDGECGKGRDLIG